MTRWSFVSGYEGLYKVSDTGRIRSYHTTKSGLRGKELKPSKAKRYLSVGLSKDGETRYFYVHRLVAAAFCPKRKDQEAVNHKDGDTRNNVYSNLNWCTASENNLYSYRVLNRTPVVTKQRKGAENSRSKPIVAVDENGDVRYTVQCLNDAVLKGLDRSCVWKAANGRLKTYKGLFWSYRA